MDRLKLRKCTLLRKRTVWSVCQGTSRGKTTFFKRVARQHRIYFCKRSGKLQHNERMIYHGRQKKLNNAGRPSRAVYTKAWIAVLRSKSNRIKGREGGIGKFYRRENEDRVSRRCTAVRTASHDTRSTIARCGQEVASSFSADSFLCFLVTE